VGGGKGVETPQELARRELPLVPELDRLDRHEKSPERGILI
jgi:hypothetical protein